MIELITLKEAAKSSGIKATVLRKAAAEDRLQAMKIGRDWMTTPEWLEGYQEGYSPKTRREENDESS